MILFLLLLRHLFSLYIIYFFTIFPISYIVILPHTSFLSSYVVSSLAVSLYFILWYNIELDQMMKSFGQEMMKSTNSVLIFYFTILSCSCCWLFVSCVLLILPLVYSMNRHLKNILFDNLLNSNEI